jgi:hypothetical protein
MFVLVDDLTGKKFGRLTVMSFAGTTPRRHALWTCLCKCGRIKVVRGNALTNGITKSCGCLASELAAERSKARARARRVACAF